MAALGTGRGMRSIPCGKFTFRIIGASEENPTPFALSLHDLTAASVFGTGHTRGKGFGEFAVGIIGAG